MALTKERIRLPENDSFFASTVNRITRITAIAFGRKSMECSRRIWTGRRNIGSCRAFRSRPAFGLAVSPFGMHAKCFTEFLETLEYEQLLQEH